MKKFLSVTLSVAISLCSAAALSSCGSASLGSHRGDVSAKNIYYKVNSSDTEFLIQTSLGDWISYSTNGSFSFSSEASDEGYSSTWAMFEYSGLKTEITELSAGDYYYGNTYIKAVNSFFDKQGGGKAFNLASVEWYTFINEYSSSNGDYLYKEDVAAAYIGKVNEAGEFTLYETYTDGRVFFVYTFDCAVYERDNVVYSFANGKETALFEDDAYHRPLQHDNAFKAYYCGGYMYFELYRDCAGYTKITYKLCSLDGAFSAEIGSRKI